MVVVVDVGVDALDRFLVVAGSGSPSPNIRFEEGVPGPLRMNAAFHRTIQSGDELTFLSFRPRLRLYRSRLKRSANKGASQLQVGQGHLAGGRRFFCRIPMIREEMSDASGVIILANNYTLLPRARCNRAQ